MSVMRTLDHPETVETKHGIKKATHEVFCYAITPFQSPPIKVQTYKGNLDSNGHFQVLIDTQTTIDLSQEEFKKLLSPTPEGKPAGDFRISDILRALKSRRKIGDALPT